ncbi:hypothetical protein ACFE04_016786 [Oxalis oulophora]
MENLEAKNNTLDQTPSKKTNKVLFRAQIFLRVAIVGTTLSALFVTITSKETVALYGTVLDARYSYSEAFKFYAYANAIVCGLTVLSLIFAFVVSRQRSNPHNHFILFVHDLFMTLLELSGCAAATAIGFLGKYGNSHTGWMEICSQFGAYCNKIAAGLAVGYLTFVFLLMLTLTSAYRASHINQV